MAVSEIAYMIFLGFLSQKLVSSATTPVAISPSSSEPMVHVSDSIVGSMSTPVISVTSTSQVSSSTITTSQTSTIMMTFSPTMPTMMTETPTSTTMMTSPETTTVASTTPGVPEMPTEFNITNLQATSVTFKWKKPDDIPSPTNYTLIIYEQSDLSDENVTEVYHTETITANGTDSYTAYNLTSFWYYRATIQATNTAGTSSSIAEIDKFQTKASAPGQVEYITVFKVDFSYRLAKARWSCLGERDRHGIITGYQLTYLPSKESRYETCEKDVEINVMPGESYQVCVEPKSSPEFHGSEKCVNYTAPEGLPAYDNSLKSKFRIMKSGQTTMSLKITCTRCLLYNTNGQIVFVGIFVCKEGAEKCRVDSMPQDVNELRNMKWFQAKRNDFEIPYRVTKINLREQLASHTYLEIVIGEDDKCPSIQSDKACNGPLQDDTAYRVLVAQCTNVGCTSIEITTFKTEKQEETNVAVPVVVTLVILLLVLAGVVGGIFLYRRHLNKNKPKKKMMVNRQVLVRNFNALLRDMHKDDDLLFLMDFEAIKQNCPDHPCLAAAKDNNKNKNRYDNILPFDRSRVLLNEIYNNEDTSYINANYISGCDFDKEFISTQGPLINTVNDFWRMVWEQDVSTLVMLSDFEENGMPKVEKYYEDLDKIGQYGNIQVILKDISFKTVNNYPDSIFRIQTFEISMDDEVRTVKHFFLKGWRDFSASVKPGVIIEFIDNVRKNVNPVKAKPIVVHCSAGVGRSGTYIALDIMQKYLRQITMDAIIDIPDLVMRLRNFRCFMVQSLPQYIFLHETIALMIERKEKLEKGLIDTDVDGSFYVTEDKPDLLQGGFDLSNASSESENNQDQASVELEPHSSAPISEPEPHSSAPISEEEIKKSVENFSFLSEEDDGEAEKTNRKSQKIEMSDIHIVNGLDNKAFVDGEAEKTNRKSQEIEMSDIHIVNGLDNKAFESDTDIDKQATPKDVEIHINE